MIKLYYKDAYMKEFKAKIVKIDGNKIYLDKTAFYPEGGGQPCDKGMIVGDNFEFVVEDVQKEGNYIAHIGHINGDSKIKIGSVKGKIDWVRRYNFMQQHTGHHILAASILKLLHSHVFGSIIFDNINKMEFKYSGNLKNYIRSLESLANGAVWSAMPVKTKIYNSKKDAILENVELRKKPKENITGPIRIVKIGNFDAVPCAGTHVKNSSEVGIIKITNFYRKTKDIWRVEFLCGFKALNYINNILNDYRAASSYLNTKSYNIADIIKGKLDEFNILKKELIETKAELIKSNVICENGFCSYFGNLNMKEMEKISILLLNKNNVILLASKKGYLLIAKNKNYNFDINKITNEIKHEFGGNGGGSSIMIRLGGIKNIENAFDYALDLLRNDL